MLALKQQFDEVNGEALNDASNDALYSPDTAFERQQYFDNVLENPDMNVYDNDVIAWNLTDTGNEEAVDDIKQRADASSGELGLNHRMEGFVDEKLERLDGSLSKNLGEVAQNIKQDYEAGIADKFGNWNEEDALTMDAPVSEEPELNMPEVLHMLEQEDPSVAVQAMYAELLDQFTDNGIDVNILDDAMKFSSDYDVLDALSIVAQENGFEGVAQYGSNVQSAFAAIGIPEAIENIAPEITEVQPEFAMNDPRFEMEQQQPTFNAMRMG